MGYPVGKLSSKYSKPNELFLVQSKWESFGLSRVTPSQAFTYFQLCGFLIEDHVEAGLGGLWDQPFCNRMHIIDK